MGLNVTSTKPSATMLLSFTATGKSATPDCSNAFGRLGALASGTTVHLGLPRPVLVTVQPGGGAPVATLSKPVLSAWTTVEAVTRRPAAARHKRCEFTKDRLI